MGPNLDPISDQLGDYVGQKYRLNWWFPEDYKSWAEQSGGDLTQPDRPDLAREVPQVPAVPRADEHSWRARVLPVRPQGRADRSGRPRPVALRGPSAAGRCRPCPAAPAQRVLARPAKRSAVVYGAPRTATPLLGAAEGRRGGARRASLRHRGRRQPGDRLQPRRHDLGDLGARPATAMASSTSPGASPSRRAARSTWPTPGTTASRSSTPAAAS